MALHAASMSAKLRKAGFKVTYSGEVGDGIEVGQAFSKVRLRVRVPGLAEQITADLTRFLTEQGCMVARHPRGTWPVLYVSRDEPS